MVERARAWVMGRVGLEALRAAVARFLAFEVERWEV